MDLWKSLASTPILLSQFQVTKRTCLKKKKKKLGPQEMAQQLKGASHKAAGQRCSDTHRVERESWLLQTVL